MQIEIILNFLLFFALDFDDQKDKSEIMTYAAFIKRYHTFTVQQSNCKPKRELNPKETLSKAVKSKMKPSIFKCLFCSKHQPSEQTLQKHQEKCQKRALKLRKKVMLKKVFSQKVQSIIVKSRRSKQKKALPLLKPRKVLPFSCDKCGDRFVSQQTLEMHVKYDHRPRPTCKFCNKVFDCRRKALEHENVCNEEDKLFTRQSLGVVDILCSTKVLTCNKCENYFTSADLLREHKHMANKRSPLPILIETETENKTKRIFFKVCIKHLPEVVFNRVKYPAGENSCPHCHKEFQNDKRLHQHSMFCHVKHNIKVKRKPALLPKTDTLCTLCNVDFTTIKKLTKHNLFFHRSKKPTIQSKDIYCDTCKKTFLTRVQYQKHFKQHGSPNICPLCSRFKHFETAAFLRWHISLVHRKKYCFTCKKAYQLNCAHKCPALALPAEKHIDEDVEIIKIPSDVNKSLTPYRDGSFKCYQCEEVFSREVYLLEHFITHTNLSPYLCKKCPKKFSDLTEFTSHQRGVHSLYDDSTAYTLCLLKSHLYKVLNITKCQHCSQIFMGDIDLNKHEAENHFEFLSQKVQFKFNKSGLEEKQVFWDVEQEVLLGSNYEEDIEECPIKSSGPPINKLLPPSLESGSPSIEPEPESSCIISLEEIEDSLLLPLNLPCEENIENNIVDIVEISSDTDSDVLKCVEIQQPIPTRSVLDKTRLGKQSRRSYSYTDIQNNYTVAPSKKTKPGRPRKLLEPTQSETSYQKSRPKRNLHKTINIDSDSSTKSGVAPPKNLNRIFNVNNKSTSQAVGKKRKKAVGSQKRKKKRFFNLYPDDSESNHSHSSMVTVNKPSCKITTADIDHLQKDREKIKQKVSNDFAPIRQPNVFKLQSHDKCNRLEKSVAEIATNGKHSEKSQRCEICNLDFLDQVTFNEHLKMEHSVSPTPPAKHDINQNIKVPDFIDISTKFFVSPTSSDVFHKRKQTKPKQLKSPSHPSPSNEKACLMRISSRHSERFVKDVPSKGREVSLKGQSTLKEYNPSLIIARHSLPPPSSPFVYDSRLRQQFVHSDYLPSTQPFHLMPPPTRFFHIPPPPNERFHTVHHPYAVNDPFPLHNTNRR